MSQRIRGFAFIGLVGVGITLTGCQLPPTKSEQHGFRGVAIEQNISPELDKKLHKENVLPAVIPEPAPDSTSGKPGVYQNVQVLGHLSQGEFNRSMVAIAQWVAPKQGCLYCHVIQNGAVNYASDSLYTKVVARRMLQMTQHINADYKGHVKETGVSCWTCHRGNNVPTNIWFFTDRYQPLRHYLDRQDFRVQSHAALPAEADNRTSIKQAEYSYALMINMSTALGVNCTFCHNSRQFSDWSQSSPQRLVALRGIRMARDLNSNYLVPLQSVWPAKRLGMHGDGPKLQCATCHNGVNKPMYGESMAKDYPFLHAPDSTAMAAAAAAATPPAPAAAPAAAPKAAPKK